MKVYLLEADQWVAFKIRSKRLATKDVQHTLHHLNHHHGQDDYVLVAHDKHSKALGHMTFSTYGKNTHVNMINVEPEHRRKGIGSGLMRELHFRHKKELGMKGKIRYGYSTSDGDAMLKSRKVPFGKNKKGKQSGYHNYIGEAKKDTPLKKSIRDLRAHMKADGSPKNPAMYHDDSESHDVHPGGVRWYHIYARSKGADPHHYGSMSYYTKKGHTYVDRMDVHEKYRRHGIATKMVRELHRQHKLAKRPGKVIYGRKTPDGAAFHKSNVFAKSEA